MGTPKIARKDTGDTKGTPVTNTTKVPKRATISSGTLWWSNVVDLSASLLMDHTMQNKADMEQKNAIVSASKNTEKAAFFSRVAASLPAL